MKKTLLFLLCSLAFSASASAKEITVTVSVPDSSDFTSCELSVERYKYNKTLEEYWPAFADTPQTVYFVEAVGMFEDSRLNGEKFLEKDFKDKNEAILFADAIQSQISKLCNNEIHLGENLI
ncbi:MAG: hypothetical protein CMJ16_02115 [Peredibacter sp.]|nr:hypothetical protein [Peredibacter sp.]